MMTRPPTVDHNKPINRFDSHARISDDELPLSELTRVERPLSVPTRKHSFQRQNSTATSRTRPHSQAPTPSRVSTAQPVPRPDKLASSQSRYKRKIGHFVLTKTLGAGSMGKVKLGIHDTTGHKVAVKIIPRKLKHLENQARSQDEDAALTDVALEDKRVMREVSILSLLHHPYIVQMEDFLVTPNHYYLMFENVEGGQLLDYIISHGKLNERTARKFSRQILSALDYCHRNSIVHRDLKIENILITNSGSIKIIDFGLSNLYSSKSHLSTFCGSLYFAAPELLCARAYTGPEVDIWSFGIVLYVLMCGEVPFDDKSMTVIHHKIKKGVVKYPAWLSPGCRHLLSRLLVTNPAERATMVEIMQHPWINKGFHGPPDNHFPHRTLLEPNADPEIIKRMTGFQFGSPEKIRQQVENSIAEINSRLPSATPSPKFPHKGSRDVQTPLSYPQLSVYYLVKEKMEREAQHQAQCLVEDITTPLPSESSKYRPNSAVESGLNRTRSCRSSSGVSGRYPSISSRNKKPCEANPVTRANDQFLHRALSDARSSPSGGASNRKPKSLSRQLSVKSDTSANNNRPLSLNLAPLPKVSEVVPNVVPKAVPKPVDLPKVVVDDAMSSQSSVQASAKSPVITKEPRRKPSRLERIGHLLTRGVSLREHHSQTISSNNNQDSLSPLPSDHQPTVTSSIPPVFIKGLFSVSSTSTKKPDIIRKEILRVLTEMNLQWREADGYISVSQPGPSPPSGMSSSGNSPHLLPPAISASGSDGDACSNEDSDLVTEKGLKSTDPSVSSLKNPDLDPSSPPRRSKSLRQRFSLRRSLSSKPKLSSIPPEAPNSVKIPGATNQPVRFEIQIVKLTLLRLHGIKFRKLLGHSWVYKDLCSQILQRLNL